MLRQKRFGSVGYKLEVGDATTRVPLQTVRHTCVPIFYSSEKNSIHRRKTVDHLPDHCASAHVLSTLSLSTYCAPSIAKYFTLNDPQI